MRERRYGIPNIISMGQLLSSIPSGDRPLPLLSSGKEWRERQLRKFADQAFDRARADCRSDHLTFQELYISVLYVYNDINKYLPGPHNDPPSKEQLHSLLEEYDINLDGLLDREEFAHLMQRLTADTVKSVGRNMFVGLILVPTVALLAKKATGGVPIVGKVVQGLPNFVVYASVAALGAFIVQNE